MVVHSYFPSVGGAEIQAARLSAALLDRGWTIRVVAIKGGSARRVDPVFERIPVLRLHQLPVKGLAGALLAAELAWTLIRERNNYSVIHVHIVKTMAFVASVVGHMLGKKVLLKVSGFDELDQGFLSAQRARTPYYRLLNWGCRKANGLIAVSRRAELRLRACGYEDNRIIYIPNGIDVGRFSPRDDQQPLRKQYGIDADRVAIFVGRLSWEKGPYDLLDAWTLVRQAYPHALLLIVGDGTMRRGMEALIRADRFLQSGVRFAGTINEVEHYLALADCYVCSSLSEGLSNTLLEAMAAGLPVVSTRVSGAEDVVQDGENGYLVPVGNAEELATGICRVFCDSGRAKKMGEKSRAVAVDLFDMSRTVERYERLYSNN